MWLPAMIAAITSWTLMVWVYPRIASDLSAPTAECEGYWPDTEICVELGSSRPYFHKRTRSNAGCPQWRIKPNWEGRKNFSKKLHGIESTARAWEKYLTEMSTEDIEKCGTDNYTPPIFLRRQRGVAWSRIEEGIIAGNSEFHATDPDKHGKICWTDALLPLYVDKFGVEPTTTFKSFVTSFDLDDFEKKLKQLRSFCAPAAE
eukprot:CAMPEP_0113551396 /NCGR_PEP_ID=MMETSP0015_2-20120614/14502_1 /TAXON_ID=2838 /ORGANISM="Odontella" /LENGTH=202 /DNA_ID=CAMNT_0000452285 /DNA_START=118 /DNA_END=726 /DNA_ORIENTATION=+ /assembly_acc=CAM_ASM_000160